MDIMGLSISFSVEANLKYAAREYILSCESEEKRQNLLKVLQNNDCCEVIAKCVDGDNISTAFVCAAIINHTDILQAFFDHKIKVDIKDRYGDTALIYASMNGYTKSVQLMLNHNANLSIQGKDGMTALISASKKGRKEIVQLLLNHNADIDLKNKDGQTALDLAKTHEIKEMIQNHVNTSYILK